jgi:ABC-type glycerol-3-phosphate transport system substrate-binding protein
MKRLAVLLLVALPVMAACGSDDDAADATTPAAGSGEPCLAPDQETPAPEYVGLDEEAATALAEENGLTLRVVGEDGECSAITMDLRDDRVNVEIVDGEVVAAAIF